MGRIKKALLGSVKKPATDRTLEEAQHELYVRQEIERSMQAATAGR